MKYNSFEKVVSDFKKIPGIGEKTARKIVFHLLSRSDDLLKSMAGNLYDLIETISLCEECGYITNKNQQCEFCSEKRSSKILIVKMIEDVLFFCNSEYDGYFHVLGGLISPINGITPDMLSIAKLIGRIKKRNIDEIIMGLPSSSDGIVTGVYIKKTIEENHLNIPITKLAEGIPYGKDLEDIPLKTISEAVRRREKL